MQVFVSGLPYETNEEKLKAWFDQEDKKLQESITLVKLPTFQDSGKCRGFAHVTFETREAYEAALKFSGRNLGKRYLDIKPAAGMSAVASSPALQQTESQKLADAMPASCKTLFVKNLPYSLQEDGIGDRFRPFGEISEVRIARNFVNK